MNDLISRQAAIDAIKTWGLIDGLSEGEAIEILADEEKLPSAQPDVARDIATIIENEQDMRVMLASQQEQQWIPVEERLPENTEPVNITWVNRKPEPYYADIKDKPFTATGHYCNGRWWWFSALCQDYLDEFGECEMDEMDGDIEVIAWRELPEPYKGEES